VTSFNKFPAASSRGSLVGAEPNGLVPYMLSAEAEEDYEPSISINEILEILWVRKWWILLAALSSLAIALGYSLMQTPMYRATASIELNPPSVPILSNGGNAGEGMVVPTTDYQFQETQIGILRSRALAERVVQDLGLTGERAGTSGGNPASALAGSIAGGLTVRPAPDSRIIELSYEADDPREAARIANSFATSFIQLTLDRKYEATTAARKFLEERIKTVREDINDAERELVAYASANGIVLLPGEEGGSNAGIGTLTGNSLEALSAALSNAQQKRITAEQRFRQAGALTEGSAAASVLRQQKAQLEAEYREKSTFLQDSFPEMARIKNRIAELDQQIRDENGRASQALGAEYRAALAEEKALQSRVSQLSGNALGERQDAIQYNILKRELDTSRSLYDALLERYNEVGVVEGIGTAQAALVDRAEVPGAPFAPSVPRNSILGLVFGLFLGASLAVLFDRLTNTIKTREDVQAKLGLSVLGVIPIAEKDQDLLDQVLDPKTKIYDAFANLRAALQLSSNDGFPKTLLMTSSRPAEGKSSSSYSLGVQLADLGNRVLLIDGDMRKPSFVVPERSEFGLSSLLTSGAPYEKHIVRTTSENLLLMPSGPVPPNPANIIIPENLTKILAKLRERFDYIIIDSPPVAGFPDAALMGVCCDGVLFTVESGKTRTTTARSAISQLRLAGVNILGVNLTKAQTRNIGYGYNYNYYYDSADRRGDTSISIAINGPAPERP
jgi:polysaccharide biosynthesis transport protein